MVGGYRLLWVTLWASVLGFILQVFGQNTPSHLILLLRLPSQRISARLGTVTGKHLAELCYENFHPVPNFLLWIMVRTADVMIMVILIYLDTQAFGLQKVYETFHCWSSVGKSSSKIYF